LLTEWIYILHDIAAAYPVVTALHILQDIAAAAYPAAAHQAVAFLLKYLMI
jgi:hypothetical protein